MHDTSLSISKPFKTRPPDSPYISADPAWYYVCSDIKYDLTAAYSAPHIIIVWGAAWWGEVGCTIRYDLTEAKTKCGSRRKLRTDKQIMCV